MPDCQYKNITINPGNEETACFIRRQLLEYNAGHVPPDGPFVTDPVQLALKDDDGNIVGGITATINYFRARCYIDMLWTDAKLRGQGFGTKLLQTMEQMAVAADCKIILVDTFSFQAPHFYAKRGYELYGKLDDFPGVGHSQYFYKKDLR
ncbi:MAG TPA: GNAT family N-acetyltransferase [Methylomusa anaerophila]|uniref:GNAT family N-acetyltransferase n=1 Tax=Methylomusa anaerophila TaxID=1930071 RepID=UPI0013155E1C|nr:GNAT family N-acetyltransferase [Methylomusa anaerophila]HML88764.1 GNAT family N-acetyltransferase [Methylomusa anaerophila]